MNLKVASLAGIIFILLFTMIASADEYVAMMVHNTRQGVSEGRIYVSNDKVVVQSYEGTVIIRGDRKMAWAVYPKVKKYMEKPFDPLYLVATSKRVPGEISRTPVGKGNIGGKMLNKFQVKYAIDGKTNTVFQWFEDGSEIPVRTATQDGIWSIEFKNIRLGPQPYDMFEIPKDFNEETSLKAIAG